MVTAAAVSSAPASAATANGNPAKVTGIKRCLNDCDAGILFAFHYFKTCNFTFFRFTGK